MTGEGGGGGEVRRGEGWGGCIMANMKKIKISTLHIKTHCLVLDSVILFSGQVEIFTNQQIDGLGLTAVSQSATLSVSAANAALNAGGGSIVLSNVEANIDLTGITCSQVTYICTRLQRNPQSQPEFILEGIPGDRVFTYCQGFSCTGQFCVHYREKKKTFSE